MKTKLFYTLAGLILATALGHALWRSNPTEDMSGYPVMTPQVRLAEYEYLRKETDSPRIEAAAYFDTLKRFSLLQQAMKRAAQEEGLVREGYRGRLRPENDEASLMFLQNSYVSKVVDNVASDMTKFQEARDASGIDAVGSVLITDPFLSRWWAFAYFALLAFTFGHFVIRIEKMGGMWWMAVMSDWRFPFWLTLCPIGVFRYPKPVDVRMQLVRAYRFATLVLGSSLSFAATGCAGKRVKTSPDKRDDNKSWNISIDTVMWPKYLGGDGAVFHPGPVQQSSATLTAPRGFYLGAWTSVPLTQGPEPNYGREIDGSFGWNGRVVGANMSLDATWIGVTPLAEYRGDVLQFTATAGRDVHIAGQTFSPYFTVRGAMPTIGNAPEGGTFFMQGVRWGFSRGWFAGTASTELMHDSGAFGFNAGWLNMSSARIGVKFGSWKVEAPFQFSTPLTHTKDGRRTEKQIGLRLAWQP